MQGLLLSNAAEYRRSPAIQFDCWHHACHGARQHSSHHALYP
jgi:hypothetical protein